MTITKLQLPRKIYWLPL